MVNCPKCKTENPDNAANCKFCHINLAFALSHPEQFGTEKGIGATNNQSPTFLLKVAGALVSEVAESTESVLQAARQLRNREGFMDGLRGAFAAAGLVGQLMENLTLAKKLCDAATGADPNVMHDNDITPAIVKARAFFQQGLIASGEKKFKEAVEYFEQSLNYAADQSTYFNIGLCFLQMKGIFRDRSQDAVTAFQRCIDLNPETETAIAAGKELARLGRL